MPFPLYSLLVLCITVSALESMLWSEHAGAVLPGLETALALE
jgi:hypothetical protein